MLSDIIWIMSVIQIQSVRDPFNTPDLAHIAVTILGRAEAMGLLPKDEAINCLDFSALRRVVEEISHAGLGQGFLGNRSRGGQGLKPAKNGLS